jgi:hypothetical protein
MVQTERKVRPYTKYLKERELAACLR